MSQVNFLTGRGGLVQEGRNRVMRKSGTGRGFGFAGNSKFQITNPCLPE